MGRKQEIINGSNCCLILPNLVDPGNNETKQEFNSYISDKNEQDACDSHANIIYLFKTIIELGLLVSGMLTVWEDTNSCEKQYRCDLALYLLTFLSSLYGVIMIFQ